LLGDAVDVATAEENLSRCWHRDHLAIGEHGLQHLVRGRIDRSRQQPGPAPTQAQLGASTRRTTMVPEREGIRVTCTLRARRIFTMTMQPPTGANLLRTFHWHAWSVSPAAPTFQRVPTDAIPTNGRPPSAGDKADARRSRTPPAAAPLRENVRTQPNPRTRCP
jgi:hypothetical protein